MNRLVRQGDCSLTTLGRSGLTIGISLALGDSFPSLSVSAVFGGRSPMHSIVRSKGQSHMIENSSIPHNVMNSFASYPC